jgi:hypothetical protein
VSAITLANLQATVQDRTAFTTLVDYFTLCQAFIRFLQEVQPTRIISPSPANHHYIFFQFDETYGHRITRPLNSNLFIESPSRLESSLGRFADFLDELHYAQGAIVAQKAGQVYIASNEVNQVVYTIQQAIGCITDSFSDSNQSRKRVGQLFERLVKLIIQTVGVECEPRTVNIPVPDSPGYNMSYQLDLVFSREKAIITGETRYIHADEIVGSVKTTSKDRIDKIFLDKYLLTKLLGQPILVVAIFLHDVQRVRRGQSLFGVNSTFKSNHFLAYTVALNQLDGVYYVDPRPEMFTAERLREQISDFQQFLIRDLWRLTA